MFLADCRICGLRELRGPRSIELLTNTDHGPGLVYRCSRCETPNALTPDRLGAIPAATRLQHTVAA